MKVVTAVDVIAMMYNNRHFVGTQDVALKFRTKLLFNLPSYLPTYLPTYLPSTTETMNSKYSSNSETFRQNLSHLPKKAK